MYSISIPILVDIRYIRATTCKDGLPDRKARFGSLFVFSWCIMAYQNKEAHHAANAI